MTRSQPYRPDPRLDLVLERTVDVPRELVWKAWTEPEHLKKWFTPAPWTTTECEIDLRPGGMFRTVMRSPEGQEFGEGASCYLEIVENEKLVWTNALEPGYRPARQSPQAGDADLVFTAVITLEPHGTGTKYTAIAIHRDEAGRAKHEQMGFHEGWGAALDQLVALVKTL
jgi:uncharacterized protein YndB with AHSA1/START domain